MQRDGEEVHIDTEEASGGDKDKSLRTALVVGTMLAIALLSVIWITGAVRFNQANPVPQPAASAAP